MGDDLLLLSLTAGSVAFVHTLVGADHYLPFVVLGRARSWSHRRTLAVAGVCGLGHVLSSVALGAVGIATGMAVARLEAVEAGRGSVAAWLLIAIGFLYGAWGLSRALRRHGHHHHRFPVGAELEALGHRDAEGLQRAEAGGRVSLTPWVLFVVFVLGPCEPLIPVLMYPAAVESLAGLLLVTTVFAVVTLATMLAAVSLGLRGTRLLPAHLVEHWGHALAGGTILASGLAIQLLGL